MANDSNSFDMISSMLNNLPPEKLQSLIGIVKNVTGIGEGTVPEENSVSDTLDSASHMPIGGQNSQQMDSIMKIANMYQQIKSPNDSRTQLLMSLKPHLKKSRHKSIDTAITLLGLTKITDIISTIKNNK